MSFEHEGVAFNLFDTPGHQDFSPKGFSGYTYRTLIAVDSAVMIARRRPAKLAPLSGIENQTREALRALPAERTSVLTASSTSSTAICGAIPGIERTDSIAVMA